MSPIKKSLLQIHTAVLLFGLAGLFGKLISLPAMAIVLGRVFFASLFLIVVIKQRKESLHIYKRKDLLYLLLLGVILAIHWGTFFLSIQISTVAIALLTFSTFPVFVTFLEPLFFKERLKRADIIVAIIVFSGVALVVPQLEVSNKITQGIFWGVISGLTFALLSLINRKTVQTYSSLTVAFYQNFIATCLLLPLLFTKNINVETKDLALLSLLGIVFTGIAHTLFINSLKKIKAQTASIIACLEPVYGIIAALFLLGEIPSERVIIGTCIILGSVFFSTLRSNKSH